MDATFRPRHFSAELFAYAENKKLFEMFQVILEKFCIHRPENPMEYLCELLKKRAVYNVPKVYVLGPPSNDQTLLCESIASKLDLVHITLESIIGGDITECDASSDWVNLVTEYTEKCHCQRNGWILEGFPTTRKEAFLLRKRGVFPSHIALIEPCDLLDMEMTDNIQTYLAQNLLILNLHRNSYLKKFTVDGDLNLSVEKVLEFVRSKMKPSMPYLPRVLLLGPYGSGRKTVAKKLTEKYNLIEVNFHQELRKAAMKESPMKEKICEILRASSSIPDELLVNVASERLMQKACVENGWVMYNFPDTPRQAVLLTKALEGFQINRVVFLHASLETCLNRVEPRRLDPKTGKVYHLTLNPNLEQSLVDRLLQLPQDSADSVEAEYRLFAENVEQMKIFFQQKLPDDITVEVDANEPADDIFESVQGALLKSPKIKISES